MKIISGQSPYHCVAKAGILLIVATLIAGTVGCEGEGEGEGGGGEYYCLSISSTYGGNITEPGKGVFTCYASEVVNLLAVPDEHYHFVEWTGDITAVADVHDASTTITIDDSCAITANFELDEGWCSLTTSSSEGGWIAQPGEGTFVYPVNTIVVLIAEPDEHCYFGNWTGDAHSISDICEPSTNITMIDSYSVVANFELNEGWYRLSVSGTVGGSVVEPTKLISAHPADTTVALVAQPDEGYEFAQWIGDVGTVGDIYDAATDIIMYDSYAITANFAASFMVDTGAVHTVGLRSDGRVLAVGKNTRGQCNVGDWKGIIQVAAGNSHTVGLRSDGTVVAVGANGAGECDVSGWANIIQVAVGDVHTVGLKSDGTVVAVGNNIDGQCDVGG